MKAYKAAIFDMDGTLVDTLADLYDSVNEMLAHYDLPPRTLDEFDDSSATAHAS